MRKRAERSRRHSRSWRKAYLACEIRRTRSAETRSRRTRAVKQDGGAAGLDLGRTASRPRRALRHPARVLPSRPRRCTHRGHARGALRKYLAASIDVGVVDRYGTAPTRERDTLATFHRGVESVVTVQIRAADRQRTRPSRRLASNSNKPGRGPPAMRCDASALHHRRRARRNARSYVCGVAMLWGDDRDGSRVDQGVMTTLMQSSRLCRNVSKPSDALSSARRCVMTKLGSISPRSIRASSGAK